MLGTTAFLINIFYLPLIAGKIVPFEVILMAPECLGFLRSGVFFNSCSFKKYQ
jgi:hypothetical protein